MRSLASPITDFLSSVRTSYDHTSTVSADRHWYRIGSDSGDRLQKGSAALILDPLEVSKLETLDDVMTNLVVILAFESSG